MSLHCCGLECAQPHTILTWSSSSVASLRRFLKLRIWWLRLNQRIRFKQRACTSLVPFLRDIAIGRRIAMLVRQYVWKVKVIQRHVRSMIAYQNAQLLCVMAQWDKVRVGIATKSLCAASLLHTLVSYSLTY